jgi:sigma-E factor negative regulatory protein RseC
MIEQQGKVIAVADGRAHVRLGGSSGCASCNAGKGCGAGLFGRLLKRAPVVLELENGVNALNGEAVMVGISEVIYLRLIFGLYLFPLIAGLAGVAAGFYLSMQLELSPAGSDATALLCGLLFGAIAVLRNRQGSREFPESFIVHLLRVI